MTEFTGKTVHRICALCGDDYFPYETADEYDACDDCIRVLFCVVNKIDPLEWTDAAHCAIVQRAINEQIIADL